MPISREDVLRVAQLAHLELAPAEVDMYQAQLDQILSYVDKLNEVDVSAIEPMSQVVFTGDGNQAGAGDARPELRDDVLVRCDTAEPILAQAPDAAKPFFRVPRVIER